MEKLYQYNRKEKQDVKVDGSVYSYPNVGNYNIY